MSAGQSDDFSVGCIGPIVGIFATAAMSAVIAFVAQRLFGGSDTGLIVFFACLLVVFVLDYTIFRKRRREQVQAGQRFFGLEEEKD